MVKYEIGASDSKERFVRSFVVRLIHLPRLNTWSGRIAHVAATIANVQCSAWFAEVLFAA